MTIKKPHVIVCVVAFALIASLSLASCKGPTSDTSYTSDTSDETSEAEATQAQEQEQGQVQSGQTIGVDFNGYDPDRNNSGNDDPQSTIYVDSSFSGSGDGSPSSPYHTIQEAVDAAANGDTIKVAKGI